MRHSWMSFFSRLLSIMVPLLYGGCSGNAPIRPASGEAHPESDGMLLDRIPAVSGPRDLENRYQPAIRVTTQEKKDIETKRSSLQGSVSPSADCSGVLIAPHLVLTAGHCVCMMRSFTAPPVEERQTPLPQRTAIMRSSAFKNGTVTAIIDSSECAKRTRITTVVYENPPSGAESSHQVKYYGTVHPHPRLELLFNQDGHQVWASADLAVIRLDKPLKDFPTFKLATSEVQPGDPITMVGYGPVGGADENSDGDRHFGPNTVGWIRRLETGSVEFVVEGQRQPDGTPAAHLFGGDSGGACLSKTNLLVGIAASTARNRKGETLSVFTSVYAHQDWLEQQMRDL